MPAMTAFWASSNEARPLTSSMVPAQRNAAVFDGPADELVDGVVPPDVLAHGEQLPGAGEQSGRVQAPGGLEHLLRGPQPVGQLGQIVDGRHRVVSAAGTCFVRCRIASRDAFPHTPHEEVV